MQILVLVACHYRLQDITPAIGAVYVAGTQNTPLQVAELVEQEQGMVARATQSARCRLTRPENSASALRQPRMMESQASFPIAEGSRP